MVDQSLKEGTQAYVRGQVSDLGRQARNGFKTVERLADVLTVILEDDLCFFETAETRIRATSELENARYFLKTGHLKGDENDETNT